MRKQLLKTVLALAMSTMLLVGCGANNETDTQPQESAQSVEVQETEEADEQEADAPLADEIKEGNAEGQSEVTEEVNDGEQKFDTQIRLGGLKGPTTMGLAKLLDDAKAEDPTFSVDFTMAAAADEITPKLIQGEMDMAAVPCNLASVLYNKTEGEIQVLCVNTLGVLSIVETGDSVHSIADLKGKTIYATGQGTTPEYSLKYLLKQNGIDPQNDVSFEWKSEATEIVAAMTQTDEEVIAMLPQPFVTVAMTQVEGLHIAVNLNDAWNELNNGSSLVTGVLVARKAFVEENKELVDAFLDSYKDSIAYANENVEDTAQLIEGLDIVKAPVAAKALPNCNITYLEGEDMSGAINGYLQILNDMEPKSIGGTLPGEDFYYVR